MAWAQRYDGVNDYSLFASAVVIPASTPFVLETFIKHDITATLILAGNTASANTQFYTSNAGVYVRLRDDAQVLKLYGTGGNLVAGEYNKITLERDAGNTVTLSINDTPAGSNTGVTGAFTFDELNKMSGVVAGATCDYQYLKIDINGTPTLNLDATASSHTAGTPILTDTIGGNNATGVNMPTDGSAWIDLGGGSPIVSIAPIDQTQTIEQVILTQHSLITIGGLTQAQSIEQVALQSTGTLSLNNLEQIQTIDQVNLAQAHIISVDSFAQGQVLEQTVLSVIGSLSINDITQAQEVEQAILTAFNGSAVNIASVSQSQQLDTVTLSQFNVVSVDNLSQSQLLQTVNFNGVVVGYLQGVLTIVSAYNGRIKLTNPLTGEIRIL